MGKQRACGREWMHRKPHAPDWFPSRLHLQSGTMEQYSAVQYNSLGYSYCPLQGGSGLHIPAVFHGAPLGVRSHRAQPAWCRASGRAVARLQDKTMQRQRHRVGFACGVVGVADLDALQLGSVKCSLPTCQTLLPLLVRNGDNDCTHLALAVLTEVTP